MHSGSTPYEFPMSDLQYSLHSMGVIQYLLAVMFLICYALALGDFLGPQARFSVAGSAVLSAVGFSALSDYWVHGVLLTAFVVVGMGLFIGVAWLLKTLVLAWLRRSRARTAASQAAMSPVPAWDEPANGVHHAPLPFPDAYRLVDEHGAIDHLRR